MSRKRKLHNVFLATTAIALMALAQQGQTATSQSLGGITLTDVKPRILTPNGDSLNDVVFFYFDDGLIGLPLQSAVFDVHGAKVGGLRLDPNDDSLLTWDGKDDSGNLMPAGIYIYMIEIGKNRATGTVVVAR